HPTPYNLHPQPSTLNPQPSTLNPQPSTLNPQPSTHHAIPRSSAARCRLVMARSFEESDRHRRGCDVPSHDKRCTLNHKP
ncbi:hypothetical protein T484DRAFT_1609996, partial [Baffinella frigidus]